MNDRELHGALLDQQGSRRDLNTPALLIDRGALDRNIAAMARFAEQHGLKLRPHAKTHKSPDIAGLQYAARAVGICCAKIGEAEAMADHGVTKGLLITSPVVSPPAVARLAALNLRTEELMCVADSPAAVAALAMAANATGKPLNLVIDIDPGAHRTGVGSAEAAIALHRAIVREPHLTYAGVQAYCGPEQHIESFDQRRAAMELRAAHIRAIVAALTEAGGRPPIVTGGGTGTHRIDPGLDLFTELQVGSYVFMDAEYLACDLTGTSEPPFELALLVEARVISNNSPGMVTIDAGTKAFSTDAGLPLIVSGAPEGSSYRFMGDEHGAVLFPGSGTLPLNHIVTLATPHCDPTVNLYDTYHVVEDDTLRALWPIAARGRSR